MCEGLWSYGCGQEQTEYCVHPSPPVPPEPPIFLLALSPPPFMNPLRFCHLPPPHPSLSPLPLSIFSPPPLYLSPLPPFTVPLSPLSPTREYWRNGGCHSRSFRVVLCTKLQLPTSSLFPQECSFPLRNQSKPPLAFDGAV